MTTSPRIARFALYAGGFLLGSAANAELSNAAAPHASAAKSSDRASHTLGFILRTLYLPVPPDSAACPVGSRGSTEMFVSNLSPEERARYAAPDKQRELYGLMYQRLGFKTLRLPKAIPADDVTPEKLAELRSKLKLAPGKGALISLGAAFAYDTCTNPEDFPQFDGGNQTYLGPVSVGANLDGKIGKDDFVGADGTRGIDNGLLRATGCNLGSRDYGDPARAEKSLVSQTAPTVIEVTGVDDPRNDDDVTVHVYAAAESIVMGANGDALYWASVNIDPNPRYTGQAKGRIVNGVLTTEPFAFTSREKESVLESHRSFVGARFRIELKADGAITGSLYGYQTLDSLDDQYRHMSQAAADFSKTSCPAIMKAIHHYADGVRDPKSGKFTAISAAYRLNGVPVFLIHPEQKTASAEEARDRLGQSR